LEERKVRKEGVSCHQLQERPLLTSYRKKEKGVLRGGGGKKGGKAIRRLGSWGGRSSLLIKEIGMGGGKKSQEKDSVQGTGKKFY